MFLDNLTHRLEKRKSQGLYRQLAPVGGPGSEIIVQGKAMVSFSSNDYLGLTKHTAVIEGAQQAAAEFGASSASSRLVAGDYPLLQALESELADFVNCEAAVVFGSGYQANLGLMSCLPEAGELILSDALNHASIIDGCRLGPGSIQVVPHDDIDTLSGFLAQGRGDYFVTESVFSMDGDEVDLPRISEVCQAYDVPLIIDDAHALGIYGPNGAGLGAGLKHRPGAIVGTFSKGLGSYGAFVAGSRSLCDYLVNHARSLIYTTAPPPASVGATLAALRLIRSDDSHRSRLSENCVHLHSAVQRLGLKTLGSRSHIIPLVVGSPEAATKLASALQRRGYFVKAIRPPTVPLGTSRVRLTMSASHTRQQIDGLIEAIQRELSL